MSRDVIYYRDEVCDDCGKLGAYDFMGDLICDECCTDDRENKKMEIDVNEHGAIRLKKVYNSIVLETENGEKLYVCMRDNGFEISIQDTSQKSNWEYYRHYYAEGGDIREDLPNACEEN
jgi:hypothetical protein